MDFIVNGFWVKLKSKIAKKSYLAYNNWSIRYHFGIICIFMFSYYLKSRHMKKTISIALVCLLLMATSCRYIESHNPFNKKKRERELVMERRMDSIRVADSVNRTHLAVRQKAVEDSLAAAAANRVNDAELKYHIIIGSFITPEYADAYASFYSGKGLEAKIIDKANSRFRLVTASSFASLSEASGALASVRETVEAGSWIYKSE